MATTGFISGASEAQLRAYLNDHLGGAQVGVLLAHRITKRQTDVQARARASDIARAVEEDRDTLRRLIDELGMTRAWPKELVATLTESLTRLKLNGLFGRGRVSSLEEWEMLSIGIEGKRRLWKALDEVAGSWPAAAQLDFKELGRRAHSQIEAVERERLQAARVALAARGATAPRAE